MSLRNLLVNSITTVLLLIPALSFGQEVHTVKRGETLYSISKEYNVSISSIRSWNDLESNNIIVGQDLTIYPPEEPQKKGGNINPDNTSQTNAYYTVKSGDTLYRIALEHDMSVDELKALNGLSSNALNVGQRLTVRDINSDRSTLPSIATSGVSSPQGKFISFTAEKTTSLQQILTRFQMDRTEFFALNPEIENTVFSKGEKLTVLAPPSKNYANPYLVNSQLEDLGVTSIDRYEDKDVANPTTNGDLYNPEALTAAHPNISLGSVVFVENPSNNMGIYVYINDRISEDRLKLSRAAWKALDIKSSDTDVKIYQVQ